MPWLPALKSVLLGIASGDGADESEWSCETEDKATEFLSVCDDEENLRVLYPFDGYSEDLTPDIDISLLDNCISLLRIEGLKRNEDGQKRHLLPIKAVDSQAKEQAIDRDKSMKNKNSKLKYEPYSDFESANQSGGVSQEVNADCHIYRACLSHAVSNVRTQICLPVEA